MHKKDLTLNSLQWLICNKNQIKPKSYIFDMYIYKKDLALSNLQ